MPDRDDERGAERSQPPRAQRRRGARARAPARTRGARRERRSRCARCSTPRRSPRRGAPSDAHASLARRARVLDEIAEQIAGRRRTSRERPLLDALADALDAEIARWETRGRDDPEARAVLRAFLGVREMLWEFGLRPSRPSERAEPREPSRRAAPRAEPATSAAIAAPRAQRLASRPRRSSASP